MGDGGLSDGGERSVSLGVGGCGSDPTDAVGEEALKPGIGEIGIGLVLPGVSEHGDVNAALAVVGDPIEGFEFESVFGPGIGEDGEGVGVEGGEAVLAVGELFGRVHPALGEIAGDGMAGVADNDFEVVTGAVAWAFAFAGRDEDGVLPVIEDDARAEFLGAPAEADHAVVFGPFEKGVVGGMEEDDASAGAKVEFEAAFEFGGPTQAFCGVAAVEVDDDGVEAGEVWFPGGPFRGGSAGLGGGGNGHFEGRGGEGFENALGGGAPVVIVDAIEDEDADGRRRSGLEKAEGEEEDGRAQGNPAHGNHCRAPDL